MKLTDLDASALSRLIEARHVSCREVMAAYLRRIEALNPVLNAIVSLRDGDALLGEAAACDAALARGDRAGWLHGVPQAIKDIALTAGIPTTMGSPLLRGFVPARDGLMVERMRAAGCIVVGKTNTPEFGLGSHTFNEVFGVTRNPFDPRRSAGGSSGGAAVALASRMLPVADGSDFMGSLRNPAGWNNVFGFRPSQGRVPSWPAADVWVTQLGTEGPMGRTVEDVARLLDIQAGPDIRTPLALAHHASFAAGLAGAGAVGVRVGWLGNLGGHLPVEPGLLDVCGQALRRLEDLGADIEPVAPTFSPTGVWQTWLTWRRWLVAGRIAPHVATPDGRAHVKPEALWEHDQAAGLTGADVLRASAERTMFFHQMLALFRRVDFLALPSAQTWPFDAALRWPTHIDGVEMDTYHRWMEVTIYATLAGLPCISVPAGFGTGGLPIGLQIIGPPQADLAVLRLAKAYEAAAGAVIDVRPAEPRP